MTMAWIESHSELGNHPKTKRLARRLGVTVPAAIGHLQCLWWWTLAYAPDGELTDFEPADLADGCLWDGDAQKFVEALVMCGFVDDGDGTLFVHDWDQYGGKLHRKREADAERKRQERADKAGSESTSSGRPLDSPHPPAQDGARTAHVEDRTGQDIEDRTGPTVEDSARDPVFRDKFNTIMEGIPFGKRDGRRMCDDVAQIAEDFEPEQLARLIARCRRDNPGKPNWPSLLIATYQKYPDYVESGLEEVAV